MKWSFMACISVYLSYSSGQITSMCTLTDNLDKWSTMMLSQDLTSTKLKVKNDLDSSFIAYFT